MIPKKRYSPVYSKLIGGNIIITKEIWHILFHHVFWKKLVIVAIKQMTKSILGNSAYMDDLKFSSVILEAQNLKLNRWLGFIE